jgi:hypothetical protein
MIITIGLPSYVDNLQYHGEGGVEYESLDKFRRERMDVELTNSMCFTGLLGLVR